jgi:ribonuclease D
VTELRAVRGMPSLSNEHTRKLMEAVEIAEALAPEMLPEKNNSERPDVRIEGVTTMLGVVAQARALEHDISRTYLAPRDQLQTLASWWLRGEGDLPPLELLRDWRRDLLGAELLDLLDGKLALALDGAAARNSPDAPVVRVISNRER